MIPILFDADARDFTSRGLGPLSDAVSCKVVEERNSTYELVMQYPKDGIHFEDIGLNKIILAIPSPYREAQPFRIYKISTPMRGVVTINAQHISYDLSGVAVMPFTGNSVADVLNKIKLNSVNQNDFEFTGNSDFSAECVYSTPYTARQILGGIEGSVIDRFGGEYEFDKFTVKWNLNRGANNGVTVRYGKNLLTLNQDVDVSKIVTGVIPYWIDSEGGSVVVGDRVNMDGEYSFEKVIPLDLSQEFEEKPSKEQLNSRAKTYINANYSLEPEINCTVSFALIEQYEEYKDFKLLEQCDLCDIVTVQYPDLGVNSTAKIVKIETDVLKERYNSVTIGSVRANIAQTIVAQQKATENLPSRFDVSQLLRNSLDKVTGAQGGTVRFLDTNGDGEPDTLYIADNPNPAEAHKVWRFNYLGWAASSNGYNGPFTLGATLEYGLLADFVTAANLTAGTIKSADNGETFFLDLLNGVLRMKASSFSVEGKSVDDIAGEAADSALSDAKKYTDTEIEATNKEIELRATKEELDELGNRVSEAESTIEVQAGLIQSKVSSADVQSMIDAIPADARNYALGTSKSKEIPKGSSILYELSPEYPYLSGRRVFISFDLNFIDFVMDKDTLLIAVGGYDGSTILEFQNKSIDIESPANEVVHVVFDISSDTEKYFQTKNLSLIIGTESSENDHIISGKKIVSNVMLNTGDKAAIWSQAPEDMVTEEKVESIIEQKADSIRLKADKISWESTHSQMTEDGRLTCEEAEIKGTFYSYSTYDTDNNWLRIENGEIFGGQGSRDFSTIDVSATDPDGKIGVAFQGNGLFINPNDGYMYTGYTGDVKLMRELQMNSSGAKWWYSTLSFVNGVLWSVTN